jgi:hypothetical protein
MMDLLTRNASVLVYAVGLAARMIPAAEVRKLSFIEL